MELSVVIPTMNKVDLLRRTLAALRGQELGGGADWEVVVVDDGSSDGTAAYLAEAAGGLRPLVRVESPGRNIGRARARNRGAQAAAGRYLLFIDDDIVAPPGLVQAHLDLLRAHPGAGSIGYAVTAPEVVDGPHFHYLDTRGVARLGEGAVPGRYFVTQNAAVPREAFLAVGGFDEEFSAYGFEDMEVAFRLEDQAGLHFRALRQPVPHHVHHHTVQQYFAKKVECGRHSLPHLARRHPARIREMQLHHVVDVPGGPGPGLLSRLIRTVAASPLGPGLPGLLARWPWRSGGRPWAAGLFCRGMDLAVLCAFRRGVTESSP